MINTKRQYYSNKKYYSKKMINHHTTKSEITGIMDNTGEYLITGDIIIYNNRYKGVLLYNSDLKCYGIYFGFWYSPFDYMDTESYGKFIEIPSDNGMRMHIKKVGNVND